MQLCSIYTALCFVLITNIYTTLWIWLRTTLASTPFPGVSQHCCKCSLITSPDFYCFQFNYLLESLFLSFERNPCSTSTFFMHLILWRANMSPILLVYTCFHADGFLFFSYSCSRADIYDFAPVGVIHQVIPRLLYTDLCSTASLLFFCFVWRGRTFLLFFCQEYLAIFPRLAMQVDI